MNEERNQKRKRVSFKEIKPGMFIRCKTEDEAIMLLRYLLSIGYITAKDFSLLLSDKRLFWPYGSNTVYLINREQRFICTTTLSVATHFSHGTPIDSVEDIIEVADNSDDTISTIDAIIAFREICTTNACKKCPLHNEIGCMYRLEPDVSKVVEILNNWKKKKKEEFAKKDSHMKEVTNQSPYDQYQGKCFICTAEEADKYVRNNCKKAHHIDVINDVYGRLENKVWWESEHSYSDVATRKIAHYNAERNMLVVYTL